MKKEMTKAKNMKTNKNLKDVILNYPLISSLLIAVAAISITYIPLANIFKSFLDEQNAEYLCGFLEQTIVGIALIMLINYLGLNKKSFINMSPKKLLVLWPMIIYILNNLSGVLSGEIIIDSSKGFTILMFSLLYLSTGFFEEILCRGFIMTILMEKWGNSKKGCYMALIISSLLFGMGHFVHFFLGEFSLLSTITQVTYAMFFGVFFGACLIKNESIFPVILVHGIFDLTSDLKEVSINGEIVKSYLAISATDALLSILFLMPLMIYGLFVFSKTLKNRVFN